MPFFLHDRRVLPPAGRLRCCEFQHPINLWPVSVVDAEDEGIGNEMAEDSASGSAPVVASIILGCAAATGFAALAL